MSTIKDWIELAPKPWELKANQEWHVFLSYRSVNRPWVIQLYDILCHLGYKVFLDQYVLAASVHLVGGLEEGLKKSASGVLIWSTAAQDSKWCEKEYRSMESLAGRDEDFHYVVTKLDKVELPFLADQRIYLDFSDYREGPRGSSLLKLLYGLQGNPLPAEAVRIAVEVDEEVQEDLKEIRGALDNGNHEKLMELARSESLAWVTTPLLGCEVAESLTKLKRYDEALSVLENLKKRFSKAIRPIQLTGLALARKGDWKNAQDVLDNLVAAGEQDPETLGIYARTWKDRYQVTQNKLHLKKSRDLYKTAFNNAPTDYYTGINAASMSVLLEDFDEAKRLAERVEKIVGSQKHEGDYWKTATVAEVQLIKENYDEAAKIYEAGIIMATEELGSHETTWNQAKLLMDKLNPSQADREKIANVFSHLS